MENETYLVAEQKLLVIFLTNEANSLYSLFAVN